MQENLRQNNYAEFAKGKKHKISPCPNTSYDINAFTDCGYIIQDDEIIVDIDNISRINDTEEGIKRSKEIINDLLKSFNIKTETVWTDRGCHLYFLSDGQKYRDSAICALGFKVEYKKSKLNNSYVTRKLNGVAREVENEGVRQTIPKFFDYNRKRKKKNEPTNTYDYNNLVDFPEGGGLPDLPQLEGRNKALFVHLHKLKENKYTNSQVASIARFINNCIFESPLPDNELETLINQAQDYNPAEDDVPEEILKAEEIIQNYRTVIWHGDLGYFHGKNYTLVSKKSQGFNKFKGYLSKHELKNKLSRFIDEVMKQVWLKSKIITNEDDYRKEYPLAFNNGEVYKGEFRVKSNNFTPYCIPENLDINAPAVKEVDDYIDTITNGDKDFRDHFLEMLGHCFITSPTLKAKLRKMFFIYGEGGEGKSTLVNVIQALFGNRNTSNVSIENLDKDSYSITMKNKLINICDDVPKEAINNLVGRRLKNMVAGNSQQVRHLFEEAENEIVNASLIFTTNYKLVTFDKSEALVSKMDWIPMLNKPAVYDSELEEKLLTQEAKDYWYRLIFEGYQRLYRNGKFTDCEIINNFTQTYQEENNSAIEFVRDELQLQDIEFSNWNSIHERYRVWCRDNDKSERKKEDVDKEILKVFDYKYFSQRMNNHWTKIYLPQDEQLREEKRKEFVDRYCQEVS